MSEHGEVMRDWGEISAKKRSSNKGKSTKILTDRGIAFESKNDGLHLVIRTNDGTVNFWPSTGRFLGGGLDGRGVFNLLRKIGYEK